MTGLAQRKEVLNLNSDIQFDPIKRVSLDPYRSVQLRDPNVQDSTLALGMAISGGGSRAEYFGLGVLMGLEEIRNREPKSTRRNFLSDIDYFSTVSGGGFAVGYYLTIQKNVLSKFSEPPLFSTYWLSSTRTELLTESISQSASPKDLMFLKMYEWNWIRDSFPERVDRELLQYGRTGTDKQVIPRLYLKDFFVSKASNENPTMPMFVANGTIYGSLERLPFMPHIVEHLNIAGSLMPVESLLTEKKESNNGYDMPMNFGITASSAFPGILPQVKFEIASSDEKVIRVMDGGVVDNLGFTTLFELLGNDKVDIKNKRALIVDCSGVGSLERFSEKENIKIRKLVPDALLFTLGSKYANLDQTIRAHLAFYDIPRNNYVVLGITTLRDELKSLNSDDQELKKIRAHYRKIKEQDGRLNHKHRQRDLFREFEETLVNHFHPDVSSVVLANKLSDNHIFRMDLIKSENFKDFTPSEKLQLYELASQVITKVKIERWEKSVLTLAGRYAVFLKKEQLAKLYSI